MDDAAFQADMNRLATLRERVLLMIAGLNDPQLLAQFRDDLDIINHHPGRP